MFVSVVIKTKGLGVANIFLDWQAGLMINYKIINLVIISQAIYTKMHLCSSS
jgi:hypothetical protein